MGETKFIIPNEVVREQIFSYLLDTYQENDLSYDSYDIRNQIIGMLRQMQGRYVKRAIHLDRPLSNLSYSVLTHRTTLYVNPSTDTI